MLHSKTLEEILRAILEVDEMARDNDVWLYARYCHAALGHSWESISARELFRLMYDKELAPPDSVSRIRRILQERYGELRGKFYEPKHEKSKEIARDIKIKQSDMKVEEYAFDSAEWV